MKYSPSVLTFARANLPSEIAVVIKQMPEVEGRRPPSEGELLTLSSSPGRLETKVEEPPPSQLAAQTQPAAIITSAHSYIFIPAEKGS